MEKEETNWNINYVKLLTERQKVISRDLKKFTDGLVKLHHLPFIKRKKNVIKIILHLHKNKLEFQKHIMYKSINVKGYSIATICALMHKN